MAPRWIKTKDYHTASWAARHPDDDWLLVSGEWMVGRVLPVGGMGGQQRYTWSLTGPHTPQAGVPIGGEAGGIDEAKGALLASWRRWQAWAGVADAD